MNWETDITLAGPEADQNCSPSESLLEPDGEEGGEEIVHKRAISLVIFLLQEVNFKRLESS